MNCAIAMLLWAGLCGRLNESAVRAGGGPIGLLGGRAAEAAGHLLPMVVFVVVLRVWLPRQDWVSEARRR